MSDTVTASGKKRVVVTGGGVEMVFFKLSSESRINLLAKKYVLMYCVVCGKNWSMD
jgi:hypothetical protein